jgi:hypothetical protein
MLLSSLRKRLAMSANYQVPRPAAAEHFMPIAVRCSAELAGTSTALTSYSQQGL